jgi:hypothetical protein
MTKLSTGRAKVSLDSLALRASCRNTQSTVAKCQEKLAHSLAICLGRYGEHIANNPILRTTCCDQNWFSIPAKASCLGAHLESLCCSGLSQHCSQKKQLQTAPVSWGWVNGSTSQHVLTPAGDSSSTRLSSVRMMMLLRIIQQEVIAIRQAARRRNAS